MLSPTLTEHEYQGVAVDFLLERLYSASNRKGGGLAADPGVGKTYITWKAIDTLLDIADDIQRVLVIGPPRPLRMVWPHEPEKFGISRQVRPFGRGMKFLPDSQIETLSRDSLHHAVAHAGRWQLLVVDESQGFKDFTSLRMRNMKHLLRRTPYRICLTGTPQPNSAADWFAQQFILDDGDTLGKGLGVFRARYCINTGFKGRKWKVRDGAKDELLEAIAPYWHRIDALDHLDLPTLVTNDMYFELPAAAAKIHRDLKRKLAAELETGATLIASNAASAYAKLRQLANGRMYTESRSVEIIHKEKVATLLELLESLCGQPLLVFFQFKHDLTAIQEKVKSCVVVDGSVSPKECEENINKWLAGRVQVLLVQSQAGAEGLNLQGKCKHVAWFGLSDIGALYTQGVARVWRQGSEADRVIVHRLLAKDSIEEVQKERLDGKLEDQEDFLNRLKAWAND